MVYLSEPAPRLCDLFLDEHEGKSCADPKHEAALAARADVGEEWSPLIRRTTDGGPRDFLDGQPIHCGTGLELQAIQYRSDDYGEWTVKLPKGTRVRYEMAWGGERRAMLHTGVSGHEFTAPVEAWMRFRLPERE